MALEIQVSETRRGPKKRKPQHKKGGKVKKRTNAFPGTGEKVRIDNKMRKLFRKRAREYNSDDEDESALEVGNANGRPLDYEEVMDRNSSREEGENGPDSDDQKDASEDEGDGSDDEGDEIQPGITKFMEGCRAFRIAFKKITKKNVSDDPLGPVLSGHKKLVAEKLAEEEAERKVKGEAKKEKLMVVEKGHVKPANFLDSNEKFLVGIATKGGLIFHDPEVTVVKLFNAVNKAQNAQKGLNPSRSKDAKVLGKRRKEAFLAELRKKPSHAGDGPSKGSKSIDAEDDNGPAWAPLRDGYMLTSSKLKNWDKMPVTTVEDDIDEMHHDISSDDD